MHVISYKMIREFIVKHPSSKTSLNSWFKIVDSATFGSFADVKKLFPSADLVGNLVVFNIGGNNYRLIVYIDYRYQKIFIRHVLTDKDYSKQKWKKPFQKNEIA